MHIRQAAANGGDDREGDREPRGADIGEVVKPVGGLPPGVVTIVFVFHY